MRDTLEQQLQSLINAVTGDYSLCRGLPPQPSGVFAPHDKHCWLLQIFGSCPNNVAPVISPKPNGEQNALLMVGFLLVVSIVIAARILRSGW